MMRAKPDDFFAVEPGVLVMYYGASNHSPYRTAPQLVCKVEVKRTTKTQVIIDAPGGTIELRFRKDDGSLVGGDYNSARLRRVTDETMRDAQESKLRRQVYRAAQTLEETARKLDVARIASGPIVRVEQLAPLLVEVQAKLEAVLGVLDAKEPADGG